MAFGVTTAGFVPKAFDDILAGLENKAQEVYGPDVDLGDHSDLKKFMQVVALDIANLWQQLELAYYAGYFDTASGDSLDRVVALIGISRKAAVKAAGAVTFSRSTPAEADIPIPSGTEAQTTGASPIVFRTTQAVALLAGQTSVDASVEAEVAEAAGNVAAGTVTVLSTPISGIEAANNAAAMGGGLDAETDAQFRARVKLSLNAGGNATLDAIRADILAVAGVTAAALEENDTTDDNTGAGGLPPKSFRATVLGGSDDDAAQAIFDSKPAGIRAYGSVSGVATADDGTQYAIYFQRPAQVTIYVDATLTADDTFPSDGLTQVETAVIDYVGGTDADGGLHTGLGVGDDVVYNEVVAAVMSVQGVVDAAVKVDTVSPPAGLSNVAIAATEVARTTTASVTVA